LNRTGAVLASPPISNSDIGLINDHRLAPIEKPFSKYPEFDQLRKIGLLYFSKLSKYLLKGSNKQGRICNNRILP
jgi:hypothetical protein